MSKMPAIRVALEIVRIVIVLAIVYWVLGFVIFTTLYEKFSYDLIWLVHLLITVAIVFVWYRRKGSKWV